MRWLFCVGCYLRSRGSHKLEMCIRSILHWCLFVRIKSELGWIQDIDDVEIDVTRERWDQITCTSCFSNHVMILHFYQILMSTFCVEGKTNDYFNGEFIFQINSCRFFRFPGCVQFFISIKSKFKKKILCVHELQIIFRVEMTEIKWEWRVVTLESPSRCPPIREIWTEPGSDHATISYIHIRSEEQYV